MPRQPPLARRWACGYVPCTKSVPLTLAEQGASSTTSSCGHPKHAQWLERPSGSRRRRQRRRSARIRHAFRKPWPHDQQPRQQGASCTFAAEGEEEDAWAISSFSTPLLLASRRRTMRACASCRKTSTPRTLAMNISGITLSVLFALALAHARPHTCRQRRRTVASLLTF